VVQTGGHHQDRDSVGPEAGVKESQTANRWNWLGGAHETSVSPPTRPWPYHPSAAFSLCRFLRSSAFRRTFRQDRGICQLPAVPAGGSSRTVIL
jgi:hypothetical protein